MSETHLTSDQSAALQSLLQRPAVAQAFKALDGNGEELRIVGGAVRDALLGLVVTEIDLATTALPEETMGRAQRAGLRAVPTGIEHGTITVVVDGAPFEVTSLREDVETDGRRATVRFGRDFTADALRRDFTINAMSLDGQGQLHDPAGGLADLAGGGGGPQETPGPKTGGSPRVRFIGNAVTRIREDYLRSLRFFRFHARFESGAPDPEGFVATIVCRDGLDQLSRERVRAELLKLLAAPGAASAIELMSGAGLLQRVSGIVAEPGRMARLIARRSKSRPQRGETADALLLLAACAVRTVEDAKALHEKLRLSGAEAARLAQFAQALEQLRGPAQLTLDRARAIAAQLGGQALADAVAVATGDTRPDIDGGVHKFADALASGTTAAPALPLRGADLLALGVQPGPAIGAMMAALRRGWLDGGCPEDEAARADLLARARDMAAG